VNYRYKEDKCPDERPICMGNVCVQCEEGKTRCSGTKVQKCMDSQWKDDPECLGICDGGRCEIYQYVRIVDLTNGSGEDPGADIDAVEIWRNGEMVGYAESIADKSKDFSHIDQSTGKHDAVVDSSTCHYKKCGTSTLLFTSLGGNNNFIVYKMSAPIYNNDIIKVYEIGGCYLDNIQSNCSVRTTYTAGKDSFQVSISTSANNNIKDIGTSVNKGPIIEFPVSF
ncbi:MAG: hypothetical protein J6A01_10770, partial [Proteobacteria bacterium]|nr:hypothetical protein [Pseudomonadota bacterium]